MDSEPEKDRSTVLAEERTEMAMKRTAIAAERTLMAWIRTALSMISFGFSIYKFVQYLHEQAHGVRVYSARNLALTLIALGTLALVGAIFNTGSSCAAWGRRCPFRCGAPPSWSPSSWYLSACWRFSASLCGRGRSDNWQVVCHK